MRQNQHEEKKTNLEERRVKKWKLKKNEEL